jgi:hypothetical protein
MMLFAFILFHILFVYTYKPFREPLAGCRVSMVDGMDGMPSAVFEILLRPLVWSSHLLHLVGLAYARKREAMTLKGRMLTRC